LPAATPAEAVEQFVRPLRRLADCITPDVLFTHGYVPGDLHVLSFGGSQWTLLRAELGSIEFRFQHWYELEQTAGEKGGWSAVSKGYMYTARERDGAELFSYQWHATGLSRVVWPHLHVPARTATRDLRGAHFPTGHVSFAAVVRLLIEELGVRPRRDNWRQLIEAAERDLPDTPR
jgi:hypothetical protein